MVESRIVDPFDPNRSWSMEALRGPEGLRRWTNDDVVPRPGDVFQERLYCIRWAKETPEMNSSGKAVTKIVRHYAAPAAADLAREARVLELLRERFVDWQREGFIPSKAIPERGAETDRLFRERGWTHWHHLFTPRQLLVNGLVFKESSTGDQLLQSACMLSVGRLANWNSRLCLWDTSKASEKGKDVFLNQALNTLTNYSVRPVMKLGTAWPLFVNQSNIVVSDGDIKVSDARDLQETCDLWITDPPYADAINYHELGDFFLAWYDKQLVKAFPEWMPDARAELAVRGDGEGFRRSMVEITRTLLSTCQIMACKWSCLLIRIRPSGLISV